MEIQEIVEFFSQKGSTTKSEVLFVVNYIKNRISTSCMSKLSDKELEIINNVMLTYNAEEAMGHDDIGGQFHELAPNFLVHSLIDGAMDKNEIRRSFFLYKAIAKIVNNKSLN